MKNVLSALVLVLAGTGLFVVLLANAVSPNAQSAMQAGNSAAGRGNGEEEKAPEQPDSWHPEKEPEKPERALTMRVLYADGEVYDKGSVSLVCGEWSRLARDPFPYDMPERPAPDLNAKHTTVLLAKDGTLPLQGMPKDEPVEVRINSMRMDYGYFAQTMQAEAFQRRCRSSDQAQAERAGHGPVSLQPESA